MTDRNKANVTMVKKILVVDDEPELAELAAEVLTGEGLEAVPCSDGGDAAIDLWKSGDFDVLVTDISMPGCDGVELSRRIAKIVSPRPVKVIFVTGHSNAVRDEIPGVEVIGQLTKPIKIEDLRKLVFSRTGSEEAVIGEA